MLNETLDINSTRFFLLYPAQKIGTSQLLSILIQKSKFSIHRNVLPTDSYKDKELFVFFIWNFAFYQVKRRKHTRKILIAYLWVLFR